MKVCAQPGCPELLDAGVTYCAAHARARDKARGTTAQRGYGREHRRTRARLLPLAYGTPCPHCGEYMWPHSELHLDHTDDRTGYVGIVCATCNTSRAATRGNRERGISPGA